MQEILQANIKSAIAQKLKQAFLDVKIYADGEIRDYPNFYIRFKNFEIEDIGLRHYQRYRLTFSLRVEYREASDTSTVTSLNTKLDNVGQVLRDLLLWLELYGKKRFVTMVNNETIDDIRIVDFYFSLIGTFEKLEEERMQALKNNEYFKEEK